MSPLARLRPYLELARISNLPTCLTNVLVGSSLCVGTARPAGSTIAVTTVVVGLLYVAGMILNDVVDARIDALDRPARPIPSGRVARGSALGLALLCFVAALGISIRLGRPAMVMATLLAVCIVAYDLLHRVSVLAVILMGACRAGVYVLAATAQGSAAPSMRIAGLFVAALAGYTMVLSLVARREAQVNEDKESRGVLAAALIAIALAPVLIVAQSIDWVTVVCGLVLVGWLGTAWVRIVRRPSSVVPVVLMWLSGICLLDAFYLAVLGRPDLAGLAGGCFVLTAWSHRRILGT